MPRRFSAQVNGVTVSALQDLFEILAATGKPLTILGWSLLQTSDLGDAAEEILRVEVVRGVGSVTSGSGGSTPSMHPVDDLDAAASATVEANNTTRMVVGSGTLETLEQYGWNVRIPWVHYYIPELRPRVRSGDRWTLALPAAPSDALTFSATLYWEED